MLTLDGAPFTTGRATYRDLHPQSRSTKSAIYVQVVLPIDPEISLYVILDTGAPYCIFKTEIAEALGLYPIDGESIPLTTAYGAFHGTIHRAILRLVAEQGDSLDIEASIFVTDDWTHENFLGYSGFLERIRFAIDPMTYSFYFGPLL